MPNPVIDPTQSIQEWRQYENRVFQLFATNSPTSWASTTPLPAGITLDSVNGTLSGAPTVPGIYIIGMIATNASGDSAEVAFYIGVEASTAVPGVELALYWDLATGYVYPKFEDIGSPPADPTEEVLRVKQDDDLLLGLRIFQASNFLDLDVTSLKLSLKEFEPDVVVNVSSDFHESGSGTSTYYLVYAKMDGDLLKGALSNYENDQGTGYSALAELEAQFPNPFAADVGPSSLTRSSRTFRIGVYRDINV